MDGDTAFKRRRKVEMKKSERLTNGRADIGDWGLIWLHLLPLFCWVTPACPRPPWWYLWFLLGLCDWLVLRSAQDFLNYFLSGLLVLKSRKV